MNKVLNLLNLVPKYSMNIKGVIHVGAHFGEENRFYKTLGIENKIFFEPQSSNFEVMKRRMKRGRETFPMIRKALGNDNKKIKMFVETGNGGQSNSLLRPHIHLIEYPWVKFADEEEVDMIRLDDCGLDLSNYNFINIDVQGYELEVFKGAVKTLEGIDYIMTEINKVEMYEGCAKVEELIEFLGSYGFDMVEHVWIRPSWGDALFIKNKKI
jgi:FkbM family methyltransferase